jgi:hypothetical protein
VHIDREDLLNSPQPYTARDLQLLWAIYKHTTSGNIGNDPLFFLTDDPKYFKSLEYPDYGIYSEFDPNIYKQAIHDVLFTLKHIKIYSAAPNVGKYFRTVAYLMYVLPYKELSEHLNREIYWEIAVWRMRLEK